jgi:hypothetical protein
MELVLMTYLGWFTVIASPFFIFPKIARMISNSIMKNCDCS